MPPIQDLPTELLDRIFSFFAEPDSDTINDHHCSCTEELYNLCLVSRRFRDLAQPLLFRYFDGDCVEYLDSFIQLTRAVYTRPELGEHIRFVTLTPEEPYASSPDAITPEAKELFQNAIRELNLSTSQQDAWIEAVDKTDLSVFVALLTRLTPKIRALRVTHGQITMVPLHRLWEKDPSYLSSLEQIWIACDIMNSEYSIDVYERFLTLPKMKSPVFEEGGLLRNKFPSTWTPGSLVAEELAFTECMIEAEVLPKLTQACKGIKSFTYRGFDPDPAAEPLWINFDVKEFTAADAHAALLSHKRTLEHLHIEYMREPWAIDGPEAYAEYRSKQAKLLSLRDFPVLETVFVQHAILPEHPQFPPSLELLHITDCNSSIREMVSNISKDTKEGLYPKLREIKVLALDISRPIKLPGQVIPANQTPAQCFASIRDQFAGTKVDFQICPYELPPPDLDGLGDEDEDGDDMGIPGIGRGPIPPGLMQMLMQRAMADPEFAALVAEGPGGNGGSERSWETDEDD
ncbi:F-box protein [Aspergillus stella-maris]|uniref:F-box protein n=1 Tax=Aspergillus stella-maris TaxID=1810926 RepID=UPI003CCD2223